MTILKINVYCLVTIINNPVTIDERLPIYWDYAKAEKMARKLKCNIAVIKIDDLNRLTKNKLIKTTFTHNT